MPWTTYKEKVKRLSERIVEAQKPIRILDAIKWDPSVEQTLRKSKFKDMPRTDATYYATHVPIEYDTTAKLAELEDISKDIVNSLGHDDALGALLKGMTQQYTDVVHMLMNRGTPEFYTYSRKLYGSPRDTFFEDNNTVLQMSQLLYSILGKIDDAVLGPAYPENVPSDQVVATLNDRFATYFHDDPVRAKLSDGILADAAAGGDVVKIKTDAQFSTRDIDILEVHEGWVHVGTTQNGNHQSVAKWLSKGPPRCSATQEGLAVIMEIFTFRTYPRRARIINDRILGIAKVEEGANILELIEFYRTEGYSEEDCIKNAKRVFRGSTLDGGSPFTKDISYCRGFIENYNFMRAAIRAGRAEILPFLFVGKLHVDDVPLLYQRYKEGIIDAPRYLPPQFRDMNGIAVWMSFSSFLNQVDLKRIQEHYDKLFKTYL